MAWFQQRRATDVCSELLFSSGHNLRSDEAVTSFVKRNGLRVTKKLFPKWVSKWFTIVPIWLTWNYVFQVLLCLLTLSQSWSEQKCKWASEAIEVRGIQRQMWTPSPLLTPLVISDPRSTIRLWDNTLTSIGISASGRGICLSIFPRKLLPCPPSLGWELVNDFSQIFQILRTLTSPIPSTTV